MKRDPALVSLSHDHHHGRDHFRLEEEILLPAYARCDECRQALVARVLSDHVAIRRLADELATGGSPSPSVLRRLGTQVSDHVRLEERELFPLIERTLPATAPADVADALKAAELAPLRPALVAVLLVWHMRRPAMHPLEAGAFVLSLAIAWLGLTLAHG